jgi:hypothetical protein
MTSPIFKPVAGPADPSEYPVTTARFSMKRIVTGSWQSPAGGRSCGGALHRFACVSVTFAMSAIASS